MQSLRSAHGGIAVNAASRTAPRTVCRDTNTSALSRCRANTASLADSASLDLGQRATGSRCRAMLVTVLTGGRDATRMVCGSPSFARPVAYVALDLVGEAGRGLKRSH